MQSVTSNAVARVLSYSIQETGGKWINGKPVYRYVLEEDVSQNDNAWLLDYLNIQDIISINALAYGYSDQWLGWFPICGTSLTSEASANNNYIRLIYTNSGWMTLRVNGNGIGYTNLNISKVRIIIEYTKTTD